MSLAATGTDLGWPDPDQDRLLDCYRAGARADCGITGLDECLDASGEVRPAWRELVGHIEARGRGGLRRLRDAVGALVDNDGITYTDPAAGGHDVASPRRWELDGIPLMLAASDWDTLEAGVVQRSRLLDAVLADLYGQRRSISSGILPPQLLFGHPGYVRAARGVENPGRHQLFMLGCDVSRAADGAFRVNADRTQAPSGAGYALADRRVVSRAVPELYERVAPRPASPFAPALRLALIDAAPASAEEPVVVVLSPGIHSETAFDQAYLATVLGFPLVESADLVVRDGKLWMRSLGSLTRVDVVLRRVDAEYADPLDLRPDSRLGVAGLVEAQRRRSVTVVNTLGSGVLESPGLQRFLPALADLLLGEAPLLATPELYWGGIDAERSHLLARMASLVIKSTVGAETLVGPALSSAQRAEAAARIEAEPGNWVGQELPQFSTAPTDCRPGEMTAGAVGLRLFTVSQRNGYAAMVGGLGYVLAPGAGAYTLKTAAAKDVWVRRPAHARAEEAFTLPPVELPGGTEFSSSPRVLSDLFWIGRYAERAEGMARLLIVTRERYHEYRNRPETAGGDSVPVLFAALRRIVGPDQSTGSGAGDEAAALLSSLTLDRQRTGSLAHSLEQLGFAARAVRDQMSTDTWMVLGAVDRSLSSAARSAEIALEGEGGEFGGPGGRGADDAALAAAQRATLAGMLALSGLTAESMVHDAGWIMMDIGKRIERAVTLVSLLEPCLSVVRNAEAEQAIIEAALVACESSVVYRRLNLGRISVAAVAELLLFDGENPRSLIYQLDRLRAGLRALPGSSGSSRAERTVDAMTTRLRRLDPDDLEEVDAQGRRVALAGLLAGIEGDLRDLSDVITRTQLSLPGEMQPIWGPDQRRVLP